MIKCIFWKNKTPFPLQNKEKKDKEWGGGEWRCGGGGSGTGGLGEVVEEGREWRSGYHFDP